MNLSLQTIDGETWKGSSLFFGGLALARAIRKSRQLHPKLVDYDRYDADCDSESFGWTEEEFAFLELCADAGETAWYRRHCWTVAQDKNGGCRYSGRMTREQAERLALLTPGLVARKIIF